ncbi:GntR family transcriptional regulator [Mycolicibacterium sp. P9-64]|uniref:GntR family transcriptional regulator n=1 Tax=Mycolicibacterium sp. P9-64 TaxID=2024612 RepID=UPI0011F059BC|nr:GntR family transcriptional regulator [Mycolicibacterium sp. P9-64]KAA0085811.1 GntR family transcriptional regulator [Mycolicibacterium sp. P9-64]
MASDVVASRPVRQVLTDHVHDRLLEMLMDGRYEANEAISIDGIARELDVSATPVREALARLEVTGLVIRVALRGYRVAPLLSADELAELIDARLIIEPVNASRACERATPALIEALDLSIADLRTAPRGPEFAEYRDYWQADMRFHELIAEGAGNRFLLMAYNCLGGSVQRFRLFTGLGVTDADFAIDEHTAILAAFQAGSPEQARQAMVNHLHGVRDRGFKDVVDHG